MTPTYGQRVMWARTWKGFMKVVNMFGYLVSLNSETSVIGLYAK